MASDNLQKWALIAEIVGGIAIVVSLGVVAFQLSQSNDQEALNTSALEISAYQDLIANITDLNEMVISNPELSVAIARAIEEPDTLSADERRMAFIYAMSLFRHGDMAYFQYERGAINEARLNSTLMILTTRLHLPFFRVFWDREKDLFVAPYVQYVDEMVERMPPREFDF
jgi:hypothetical protein